MTRKKSILNICLILNLAQLVVSSCAAILRNFGLLDNLLVKTSMFALQIFVWILLTMNIFVKRDIKNKARGFVVGVMSVVPALIMTVAAVLISHYSDSNSASWVTFAFLGSSLSFYNKSAVILTDYIPVADAYLIFCANYAVMILCSFIGGFLGASSNLSLDKKKEENRQEKTEELSVTKILDDLEEKEVSEEYSSEEDAELTDVVLDEEYTDEGDDSTVATVITVPADDEDDEDSGDETEETLHEAISIISVDVDELEDEAEDMFRKRYDDMNIDNDFHAMKAEADGLLEIASEINSNIDGIIVELDTILQSEKVSEKVVTTGKQEEKDEIDTVLAQVFEDVYETEASGALQEYTETAEEIVVDEDEIIIGDEDIIRADEIFEEVVSEYADDIDITEIELAEDEAIEVGDEIIDIFGEDEDMEPEEYVFDAQPEESVEEDIILTEEEEITPAEDMSIEETVIAEARETTEEICEVDAEQNDVDMDAETVGNLPEEPVSEEKTLEQEIFADEVSIDDIVFADEVPAENAAKKDVDPEVAALVKELEEKRLAQRRKKQKEQDFDNWLNRRTTRIDTNEIREVLRKAGISDNEEE